MEQIISDGQMLAIIIRGDYKSQGLQFFTPPDFSQQLAYMNHPRGHSIMPHRHRVVPRQVTITQEVLIIKSGSVRVDFYDNSQTYLESRILNRGDVILLASGGHGFEMLEASEIIEIKQGPYAQEEDKVRFPHSAEIVVK